MAIKPEFFTHEGLFELERKIGLPMRVAFAGLWSAADREGRFKWEPRRLGIAILPYDGVDFSKVLDAFLEGGFVVKYAAHGITCGHIPSFKTHQHINMRESASILPSPTEGGTCIHVQARDTDSESEGINIPSKVREFVFERDGKKCKRCGSESDITLDHIFPQSIGGTHTPTNLRPLCRQCNSARPVDVVGLADDLSKDGLTLDDMQRTCMHVPYHVNARGEGKGKGREGEKEGNGNGTTLPPSSTAGGVVEGNGNRRLPTTEQSKRIATIFHRRLTTAWADDEVKAYHKLGTIPADDLSAVERYYSENWPPERDKNILRHDMLTFLNNFTGEVDRANSNQPKTFELQTKGPKGWSPDDE